jgi:hypothetical protein
MNTSEQKDAPRDVLIKQIVSFFPSYYITFISMIQASCLAYLFVVLADILARINTIPIKAGLYLMIFATLLIIITVWYEYMMGTTSLRWIPNIYDSYIPFLIGISEFSLIICIKFNQIPYWFSTMILFFLFGYIAYVNMYTKAKKLKCATNKLVLENLGGFSEWTQKCAIILALVFLIFYLLSNKYLHFQVPLLIISNIIIILFMYRGHLYWNRIIGEKITRDDKFKELPKLDYFNPDKLSKSILKTRLSEVFPSVYLTTISIIQGVALGLLAQNYFLFWHDPRFASTRQDFIPYVIFSLFCILIVSYEYVWFIGIFRANANPFDTSIPIMLGAAEVCPTFYLADPQAWWGTIILFATAGAIAWLYTAYQCKYNFGEDIKSKQAHRLAKNGLWLNVFIVTIMALLGSAIYYHLIVFGKHAQAYLICLLVVVVIGMMIKDHLIIKKLKEIMIDSSAV